MLTLRKLGLLVLLLCFILNAQSTTGMLRGVLTDNSGAVIPAAKVTLSGNGPERTASTQVDGTYSFAGLPPGSYTVKVSFPGFGTYENPVTISPGQTAQLAIQLRVALEKQQVTVAGQAGHSVSVEPDNNASAVVIKGSDLEALPDDPDDLRDTLAALAGPAAGPNGGEIFVDGFSGGKLPSKNAIREIRMNQNPFSAEYDRLGMGRIEILTKPGSEKFKGSIGFSDSEGAFNSRNPYAENKADYSNRFFFGEVSGPLGKRASFYFDAEHRTIDNNALINAVFLDASTLLASPVRNTVTTPSHGYDFEPRIDFQLSKNHTLTGRFGYDWDTRDNNGIGQYSLISRAYASKSTSQSVRITETAIVSPTAVNETRFGFHRNRNNQFGDNSLPAINVTEAFMGGGAQVGRAYNLNRNFEIANNTSMARKAHTYRFGARVRRNSASDYSPSNFGGTFTFFGVGNAPVLNANDQPIPGSSTQIGSLEQYRRTLLFQRLGNTPEQIRALGGGASQFSIAGGDPLAEVGITDLGAFVQDDWRMKPNLTLSFGLRYETQSDIHDWRDFAPRIGLAISPKPKNGKPSGTVVRAGFGMYYNRVRENVLLQEVRFDGIQQQQFLVMNPDFFPIIPSAIALAAQKLPTNIYQLDRKLQAPYMMQSIVSLERQLPFKTSFAATYMNLHALHQMRTVNINAPLPGTYDPTVRSSGLRPYGSEAGNLFQYQTTGVMNQSMLLMSVNTRFSSKVSLNGALQTIHANSDADGAPSNPYNLKQDYGRATFSRRYFAQVMGSVLAPLNIRLNPMLVMAAGAPYNLISGQDLNGDTISNDRPAFASDLTRASVVQTRFGAFDTNPLTGQSRVPRNYLTGDSMWNLNVRIGRTFNFFRKGGGKGPAAADSGMRAPSASLSQLTQPSSGAAAPAEYRFSLNLNTFINNVFNHLNKGGYVGNLASPLFGQSTSINLFRETSNNRRIQVGMNLSF